MVYYINFGFVLEQALADVMKRYIDRLHLDEVYGNFHISVVNDHPFAHMIVDEHIRASDTFPAIVVSTQSDSKPGDLANVPNQTFGIGMTSTELDNFINLGMRDKTKINSNGEVEVIKKGGVIQRERIPGFILISDPSRVAKLKEIADSRTSQDIPGKVYGIQVNSRRRDKVSIEIWCENNQLKNELYEHLRLLCTSSLEKVLQEQYSCFDCSIFDNSVSGERGSNYNFDFDTLLYGSHISFDVDYNVAQYIFDTEITELNKDIIVEVINHVKE